jgi:haloacid dehalogenase-like hydrolase
MLNNEQDRPVLVFDLDGTILDCNSFPAWVLFLAYGPISGLPLPTRLLLSLRVHRLLLGRRLGRPPHNAFVSRLRECWLRSGGDISTASRFYTAMQARVRPCLNPALALVAAGADAVLATAAAAEYAEHLGRLFGFRHILATEAGPDMAGRLNSGQLKCDRVLALLRTIGWDRRPMVFLTDHPDDLPLIMHSSVVFWFGTPVALARVRARAKHVDIVDCSGYTANAVAGLLKRLGVVTDTPAITAS